MRKMQRFLLPLGEKVARQGRMRGKPAIDSPSDILRTDAYPSSVSLREPPSPSRGEGYV